jgi:hypothetical protein
MTDFLKIKMPEEGEEKVKKLSMNLYDLLAEKALWGSVAESCKGTFDDMEIINMKENLKKNESIYRFMD